MAIIITTKQKLKTHISARLMKIAGKIQAGESLSKTEIKEAEKTITKATDAGRSEFLALFKKHAGQTEEEILESIKDKIYQREGVGKPADQDESIVMTKQLLAYRLQQRGLTLEQIAEQLQVSASMVTKYLKAAKDYLRIDPVTIDIPQQAGETLHFYSDVRSMALMMASVDTNSSRERLAAMSVALQAERDRTDYLTRIGVYSPSVIQVFQQNILNQMNLAVGESAQDTQTKTTNVLAQLAQALMDNAEDFGALIREKEVHAEVGLDG